MCTCLMTTKTSTLIKSAFSVAYMLGSGDAAQGRASRPLTAKQARRAVRLSCRCETAKLAERFVSRAYRIGYDAGFADLFATEERARNLRADPDIVSIEAARSARLRQTLECDAPLVAGDMF